MKYVNLTQNEIAIVDDDDYEKISAYKWRTKKGCDTYYAVRGSIRQIFMHRVIMNCPYHLQVDHINHNGLDNRKENLKIVTNSQNQMNQRKQRRNTKYPYKGICKWRTLNNGEERFRVQIKKDGKRIIFGYFKTPEDAARAYDQKAIELFGEHACTNKSLKLLD